MAGFIDKIKQSASEASKKALATIEINRLKMQIASQRKEIERIYALMGEAVYQQIGRSDNRSLPEMCVEWARHIDAKMVEIEQLEDKIYELKEETICTSCGHVNPRNNQYCSGCGAKLKHPVRDNKPAIIESDEDIIETEAGCPSCGHPVEPGKKFCGRCGQTLES